MQPPWRGTRGTKGGHARRHRHANSRDASAQSRRRQSSGGPAPRSPPPPAVPGASLGGAFWEAPARAEEEEEEAARAPRPGTRPRILLRAGSRPSAVSSTQNVLPRSSMCPALFFLFVCSFFFFFWPPSPPSSFLCRRFVVFFCFFVFFSSFRSVFTRFRFNLFSSFFFCARVRAFNPS